MSFPIASQELIFSLFLLALPRDTWGTMETARHNTIVTSVLRRRNSQTQALTAHQITIQLSNAKGRAARGGWCTFFFCKSHIQTAERTGTTVYFRFLFLLYIRCVRSLKPRFTCAGISPSAPLNTRETACRSRLPAAGASNLHSDHTPDLKSFFSKSQISAEIPRGI